ncbi:MAG: hypothetical protein SAK29_11365 [Scytonema sp. PMC 1069.18]|nr:hypothetical protein [Scytonema sp. PMC 1069.18]MEC4883672.1 hypothetical protein [Scytonema sp. PMC 1070.18]
MFHQFDCLWATYNDCGDTRDLTDEEKGKNVSVQLLAVSSQLGNTFRAFSWRF